MDCCRRGNKASLRCGHPPFPPSKIASAHLGENRSPIRDHLAQVRMFGVLQMRITLEDQVGGISRQFHEVCILENVADLERREPTLGGAENVAWSADAEVLLGDFKSIHRA